MEFPKKTVVQVRDLLRSMTPAARITAGLLLVVVVAGLGYLCTQQASGPDVTLLGGEPVPAAYLPAIETALANANLTSYTIDGGRIRVPRGQQSQYMAALAEAKALPPTPDSVARDAQNSGNPFEPAGVRQDRLKLVREEQLALIIRAMRGIESAYVLYDTETRPGLNHEKLVTASVSVKPLGAEQLDESRVSAIRHLVAGSIAGLKPENVTVADLNGRVHHGGKEGGSIDGENLYLAVKQMHERDLKTKILDALKYIPNLTVAPSVVLDQQRLEPANAPSPAGTQPNAPACLSPADGKTPSDEMDEETKEDERVQSGTPAEQTRAGLTLKSARVSVGIPSSYFVKVWREENRAGEGEEPAAPDEAGLVRVRDKVLADVRKHVATLLPPAAGIADPIELVTVTTFQDFTSEDHAPASARDTAVAWLARNWRTVGLGVTVIFVGLVMLRARGRRAAGSHVPATPARPPKDNPPKGKRAPVDAESSRRTPAGAAFHRELSDFVRKDPGAAANVLRTWIGNAS